jgi:hypothetical protein
VSWSGLTEASLSICSCTPPGPSPATASSSPKLSALQAALRLASWGGNNSRGQHDPLSRPHKPHAPARQAQDAKTSACLIGLPPDLMQVRSGQVRSGQAYAPAAKAEVVHLSR